MKLCPKCGTSKAEDEFYVNRRSKDGLQSLCKPCSRAYAPYVLGLRKPNAVVQKQTKRQAEITKYGIDIVEVLDTLGDYD